MATVKPFRALRFLISTEDRRSRRRGSSARPMTSSTRPCRTRSTTAARSMSCASNSARPAPTTNPAATGTRGRRKPSRSGFAQDVLAPRRRADSFYLYEQTFDIASGGASRSEVVTRRGIFGAVKLEPFGNGKVFPHEETFGAPKADRLSLMQACAANLSPVFGLIPDEDSALTKLLEQGVKLGAPAVELTEANGVQNRLWAITDETWIAAMAAALEPRNCYIADGHHRYETSCNYRDERRAQDNDPRRARSTATTTTR